MIWILITILAVLIGYLYYGSKADYKYWERKGVAYEKPKSFTLRVLYMIFGKVSVADVYSELYKKFVNEKVAGIFEFKKPVLVVRDLKLIEKIMVKDFQYFTDHEPIEGDDGLFSYGLFQLKGNTWRAIRYKLSPAFTSGKLKLIFNSMLECTDPMIETIRKNLNKDYEVKEALSNFTMDVIADAVFGIQMTNEKAKNEFSKMGSSIFALTPLRFATVIFMAIFPKLSKFLGIQFLQKETSDYFNTLIKNTFESRKDERYQRNDYVNHLVKLKEKGTIEIQSKEEDDSYLDIDNKSPVENIEITDKLLYGQAFQFLTAGFEPLFNTLLFALYDMSLYPETQERARQEVKDVIRKHGSFSYEAVKEMTYLEQCIQETLRKNPLTPFLFRQCTKNYVTPDGLEIEKGTKIIIPINAIHMDTKYYTDPEVFNPERLPPNSIRSNYTYMPFGDGPRMCIGVRFALLELKVGLAKLLDYFKFTLSPKTKIPFKTSKLSFIPIPITPIIFNVTPV